MAKWATYNGDGNMSISGAEDKSRTLGKGQRVDLDEVLIPAQKDRKAQTLGDAVAGDIHLFVIEDAAPAKKRKPEPDNPTVDSVL